MGIAVFIGIVAVAIALFRIKRKREVIRFKETNFADYVEFDSKADSSASAAQLEEFTRLTGAALGHLKADPEPEAQSLTVGETKGEGYRVRHQPYDRMRRALLGDLVHLVEMSHFVLTGVKLDDLVEPLNKRTSASRTNLAVDFALIRRDDFSIDCALLIDGANTRQVSEVLLQAGLPLVVLKPGQDLSISELGDQLSEYLSFQSAEPTQNRRCERCKEEMTVRRVTRQTGEQLFCWVCTVCKVTTPVR